MTFVHAASRSFGPRTGISGPRAAKLTAINPSSVICGKLFAGRRMHSSIPGRQRLILPGNSHLVDVKEHRRLSDGISKQSPGCEHSFCEKQNQLTRLYGYFLAAGLREKVPNGILTSSPLAWTRFLPLSVSIHPTFANIIQFRQCRSLTALRLTMIPDALHREAAEHCRRVFKYSCNHSFSPFSLPSSHSTVFLIPSSKFWTGVYPNLSLAFSVEKM